MKCLIITISLLLINLGAIAQKHQLGISSTVYGIGDLYNYQLPETFKIRSVQNVGLIYNFPLSKDWKIESGVFYSIYTTQTTNWFDKTNVGTFRYDSWQIPLNVKYYFFKYCFAYIGLVANIENSPSVFLHNTSGLGANLGIGAKYDFNFGGSIYVNPYVASHGLTNVNANKAGINEFGIRLGFLFSL